MFTLDLSDEQQASSLLWRLTNGFLICCTSDGGLIRDKFVKENSKFYFWFYRPNSGDEATLSVDNAQRVLILGTSKDFGVCKAMWVNYKSNSWYLHETLAHMYYWVAQGQSFWLQIQRSWVRFPALPDFLRSSGSGTGSTQPHEDNW
jgi:hypothetical protein